MAPKMRRPRFGLRDLAMIAGLFGALFAAGPASASLVLVQDYQIQQTLNNPCVIGDPSCNQGGFRYYSVSGSPGTGSYDLFSPNYRAGAALAAPNTLPRNFSLGIDQNQATGATGNEELVYWKTFSCLISSGNCSANTTGGSIVPGGATLPIGFSLDSANSYLTDTVILDSHNGNGFSDAILTGFGLTSGYSYLFEVSWKNDADPMEEFFVIPGANPPSSIPEPASLAIFGTALAGLGFLARLRRRTSV
jgi:hypothetical protein